MTQRYEDFALEALDRLTTYEAENGLPSVAHALPYWALDLRRDTDNGRAGRVTHGPNELGIDAYVVYDGLEFSIIQCKSPDRAALANPVAPAPFDESVVEQILTGTRYLTDRLANPGAVNDAIVGLKTKFQSSMRQNPESTKLNAIVVVLGTFTANAKQKIDQVLAPQFADLNATLELVEWADLSRELLPSTGNGIDSLTLTFADAASEVLDHGDFVYMLARGIDLVRAYEEHGLALFDLNVRSQITRSRVNLKIRETLKDEWGRNNFHHLNNGLLVICDDYSIDRGRGTVTLKAPQIVNGCQTVSSLAQAFDGLPALEQAEFENAVLVQSRVLRANEESRLLDKVVVASNDQNKMNARNLRSNTDEQLTLQRALDSLEPAWFYQRKDGEWETRFLQLKKRGEHIGSTSPIAKYKIAGERGTKAADYRVIDNEPAARGWYACLGESHRMVMGTVKLFETQSPFADGDENRTLYDDVFRSCPSGVFWRDFANPAFVLSREHLTDGSPGHYQFLLSHALSRFIAARKKSPRDIYDAAVARAVESGELQPGATEEKSLEVISQDLEYMFEGLLSNTDPIATELMWFVLTLKYGRLDGQTARRLLLLPELNAYAESGFRDYRDPALGEGALLWPTFEFVKFCYLQFFGNSPQVQHGKRGGRSEMSKRANVNGVRKVAHDYYAGAKRVQLTILDHHWKPAGTGIEDILPELSA